MIDLNALHSCFALVVVLFSSRKPPLPCSRSISFKLNDILSPRVLVSLSPLWSLSCPVTYA